VSVAFIINSQAKSNKRRCQFVRIKQHEEGLNREDFSRERTDELVSYLFSVTLFM
jgi:hypothetical protein